jgi:predicted nucleic acid-binding protein
MYLLDTNTIIDFCNSKLPENAKKLLTGIEPSISVITQIELFASAKIPQQEKLKLEAFVDICTVYDSINANIVAKTIAIRQQHKTKLPDAIIAATALVYDLVLISRNTSDFKNVQGLKVVDPFIAN